MDLKKTKKKTTKKNSPLKGENLLQKDSVSKKKNKTKKKTRKDLNITDEELVFFFSDFPIKQKKKNE